MRDEERAMTAYRQRRALQAHHKQEKNVRAAQRALKAVYKCDSGGNAYTHTMNDILNDYWG